MRSCRKCQAPIPVRAKVGGTLRNLQRRKFCLQCSPFGSHNTKADDPARPSRTSAREDARRAWALSAKRAMDRAREMKAELVAMSGGRCSRCPYDRYLGALEFHHRDPSTKKFSLAVGNLRGKPREVVLEEWRKCVLLCANCHREVEDAERRGAPLVCEG